MRDDFGSPTLIDLLKRIHGSHHKRAHVVRVRAPITATAFFVSPGFVHSNETDRWCSRVQGHTLSASRGSVTERELMQRRPHAQPLLFGVNGKLTEAPHVGHTKEQRWRFFLGWADCDGANHFPIREGQEPLARGKPFGSVGNALMGTPESEAALGVGSVCRVHQFREPNEIVVSFDWADR